MVIMKNMNILFKNMLMKELEIKIMDGQTFIYLIKQKILVL